MYAMVAMGADISFALNTVSKFMSKVGPLHWMAVNHIMRYLKGISDFKLYLGEEKHCLDKFLLCVLDGRYRRPVIYHILCVTLLVFKLYYGNAKNYQPLHYLQSRWCTWLLAIILGTKFDLGTFWWM